MLKTERSNNPDICEKHSEALYYWCRDCREAICADCAVYGDEVIWYPPRTHKHSSDIHLPASDSIKNMSSVICVRFMLLSYRLSIANANSCRNA